MALLRVVIEKIMSVWTRATGLEPTKSSWNSIARLIPPEILAKVRLRKSVEAPSGVPHFGSRVLSEAAVMLEDFIKEKGSNTVNRLQCFPRWCCLGRLPSPSWRIGVEWGEKRKHPYDQRSIQRLRKNASTHHNWAKPFVRRAQSQDLTVYLGRVGGAGVEHPRFGGHK